MIVLEVVTIIVVVVCTLGILFCQMLLIRNERVADERIRVINEIFLHPDWHWRLTRFELDWSFNEMLRLWWKPVSWFYHDREYLQ